MLAASMAESLVASPSNTREILMFSCSEMLSHCFYIASEFVPAAMWRKCFFSPESLLRARGTSLRGERGRLGRVTVRR